MKVAVMLLIYFCLYLLGAVLTDLCLRKWKRTTKLKASRLRVFLQLNATMVYRAMLTVSTWLPVSQLLTMSQLA